MDFPTILARLNDLPNTFKRNSPPYTQIIDSIAAGVSRFTLAADATNTQVQAFGLALDGWLDVWGLLFGVPRNQGEANSVYSTRIIRTVLAWVGTLPALQAWVAFYAPGGSIEENPSGLGYSITLPATMTAAQALAFIQSLNRIRPAGVPFTVGQISGGLFLGTEAFLGQGTVQGAYLTASVAGVLDLQASTPNSVPLLPALYFADFYLGQPGLLSLGGQGTWPVVPQPPASQARGSQFWSNGGVLTLIDPTRLPLSPAGLAAGAYWSDTGEVSIVSGLSPAPAAPLFFPSITLQALLSAGSTALPTANPGTGTLQLWNDGDVVAIA